MPFRPRFLRTRTLPPEHGAANPSVVQTWTQEHFLAAERAAPKFPAELYDAIHQNGSIVANIHFMRAEGELPTIRKPRKSLVAHGMMTQWPGREVVVPSGIPVEVDLGSMAIVRERVTNLGSVYLTPLHERITVRVGILWDHPDRDTFVSDFIEAFTWAAISGLPTVEMTFLLDSFVAEGRGFPLRAVRIGCGVQLSSPLAGTDRG